jgi:hypothetical protein
VVDARWFEQWCGYTGFNSNTGKAALGRALSTTRDWPTRRRAPWPAAALKLGINEREDYVLVHEKVWHLLMNW